MFLVGLGSKSFSPRRGMLGDAASERLEEKQGQQEQRRSSRPFTVDMVAIRPVRARTSLGGSGAKALRFVGQVYGLARSQGSDRHLTRIGHGESKKRLVFNCCEVRNQWGEKLLIDKNISNFSDNHS